MLEQFFRNPELFHPHKWQAHDPTKKTNESSEDDHLRITTKTQVATRAKTSFAEKKKIKIIKMAFLSPTCGNTRTQCNHLRIKNRFPKLQCRRKLVLDEETGKKPKGRKKKGKLEVRSRIGS
jgi:hypothetical protein